MVPTEPSHDSVKPNGKYKKLIHKKISNRDLHKSEVLQSAKDMQIAKFNTSSWTSERSKYPKQMFFVPESRI